MLGDLWSGGALLPAGATITKFLLALGAAIVLGTVLGLLVGGVRSVDWALPPTLHCQRFSSVIMGAAGFEPATSRV